MANQATEPLYANEEVIGDSNYTQYVEKWVSPEDGENRAFGLVPRNYETNPLGSYPGILPYTAVEMPLIPRSEWPERIKDQLANKARLSDIRMKGKKGGMIPSTDQNGRGYCWFHSGTSCCLLLRAVANLPWADLSAYAGACVIKNFRDEGGWGAQGVDFMVGRGIPTSEFWPQRAVSRQYDNEATWKNAALHKVVEGFIDLARAQYDRNLSWDQEITCYLCGIPVVKDENWWGHSICGMDAVDGNQMYKKYRGASGKLLSLKDHELFWGINDPVTQGIGVRIWNSWGDSWSSNGMGVLTGSKAPSDGSVAPRTILASAA